MRKFMLSMAMAALSLMALASMVSACSMWGYQPSVPTSLRK